MLETYITPLLMSYLDKYVRNIHPSDLKLSFWGGDVVLNNLELRLEVLSNLIPLPITFVSGRIRELRIHVPWTALGSESVDVSIDTIECVLRWDEDKHPASTDGADAPAAGQTVSADTPASQATPPPPGYVQSLINKIINNFSVKITNLVLKYVEDDVVLSLNARELTVGPADELWTRTFVDVSSPFCVLRRLVSMSDMTVCLDQPMASGVIDTYQVMRVKSCRFIADDSGGHCTYGGVARILKSLPRIP